MTGMNSNMLQLFGFINTVAVVLEFFSIGDKKIKKRKEEIMTHIMTHAC